MLLMFQAGLSWVTNRATGRKEARQKKKELSQSEFRAMCREYAKEQIDIQKDDFIRLGVFGDWDNRYGV